MDPSLQEAALVAFATFFATIGPVDVAALFAALTPHATPQHRRAMALKAVAIATTILLLFAIFGNTVLVSLGISLAAMRTAGGILLMLVAIDMVFARHSGVSSATDDETEEARLKKDISVFPLATPLIAGPGSMGAVVLLTVESGGDLTHWGIVVGALMAVLLLTLVLLLLATQVQKLFGVTGLNVVSRVAGVLLAALAVQFIFDGLSKSPLFS
ncbi:MAG TPA: MarC family protein [Magnetovibrio sp.]